MKIVCFGDSNTLGYDPRGFFGGRYDEPWPEILAGKMNCTVINQGQNGREIPGQAMEFPADADILIVMLGTNDLLQGSSPETVCRRMERFLASLETGRDRILLVAPPPMCPGAWVPDRSLTDASRSLAARFAALASRLGVRFADAGKWDIPMAFDGVHFTQEGHHIFANSLLEILK